MSSGITAVKHFKASTAECDEEETLWDGERFFFFCLLSVLGVGVSRRVNGHMDGGGGGMLGDDV